MRDAAYGKRPTYGCVCRALIRSTIRRRTELIGSLKANLLDADTRQNTKPSPTIGRFGVDSLIDLSEPINQHVVFIAVQPTIFKRVDRQLLNATELTT